MIQNVYFNVWTIYIQDKQTSNLLIKNEISNQFISMCRSLERVKTWW